MVSQGGLNNIIVNESGTASTIENYKIVILGDQYVGKTSILHKYKYESVEDKYAPTVGIDFLTKNVFLEDKTVRLVMWDTAGSERFQSLIPSYLKNTQAIIWTFDITSKKSFNSIPNLMGQIGEIIPENVFMIITGNKLDCESNRQVSKKEAEEFAKGQGMIYVEVSAKTGENICRLFEHITNSIYASNNVQTKHDHTLVLDDPNKNEKSKFEKKPNCCEK